MEDKNSEDALYEALTINKVLTESTFPREYVRGKLHDSWWGWPGDKKDTVYLNAEGQKHRIYGPAFISQHYKVVGWYKEDKLHREDGPAWVHKTTEIWFYEGKLHRLDGPAVSGQGHPKEYWINGQRLSPKEYKKEIERRRRKGLIK